MCKRGWVGLGLYTLCRTDVESVQHLFVLFPFTQSIWTEICNYFIINQEWHRDSVEECLKHWMAIQRDHYSLASFACWGIWRCRNYSIFEEIQPSINQTCNKIIQQFKDYMRRKRILGTRILSAPNITTFPIGFFDGTSQANAGGCGMVIWINSSHSYHYWMGIGSRSNNFAELVVVWALLHWAERLGLSECRVFGDSRVVIGWLQGKTKLKASLLQHWYRRTLKLIEYFEHVSFEHVYRCFNSKADPLSKRGIGSLIGILFFEEFTGSDQVA